MRNGIFGITLAVSCAFGTVSVAQNLGAKAVPAELPPSSFSGRQYVDSKGCVYIRAGVSGVTNWVPRVSRDRNVICGQTPTFAGRTAVAAAPTPAPAAPVAVPAPKPVVRQVAAPAPRRVVRQPAPAPVAVQPVFTAQRVFQNDGASTTGAVASTQTRVNLGGTCPNASAASRAYMNTVGVRCGSQAWKPETAGRVVQSATANTGYVAPTYVAPTYANNTQGYAASGTTYAASAPNIHTPRILSDANAYTPKNHFSRNLPHRGHGVSVLEPGIAYQGAPSGYRNSWDDGRLNPARGIRGQEIYQGTTGYVVNAPGVRVGPQANVGWYPPRPGTSSGYSTYNNTGYAAATNNYAAPATNYASTPTVSTRSSAPQAAVKPRAAAVAAPRVAAAPSGHRWVQVGSFSGAGAQQTARRFQSMGLPVRIGKAATYQVVLIGPYSNGTSLSRALSAARSAGYGDAYTRR